MRPFGVFSHVFLFYKHINKIHIEPIPSYRISMILLRIKLRSIIKKLLMCCISLFCWLLTCIIFGAKPTSPLGVTTAISVRRPLMLVGPTNCQGRFLNNDLSFMAMFSSYHFKRNTGSVYWMIFWSSARTEGAIDWATRMKLRTRT